MPIKHIKSMDLNVMTYLTLLMRRDNKTVNFKLAGTIVLHLLSLVKEKGQMWEFLNLFKQNIVNLCDYNPKRMPFVNKHIPKTS